MSDRYPKADDHEWDFRMRQSALTKAVRRTVGRMLRHDREGTTARAIHEAIINEHWDLIVDHAEMLRDVGVLAIANMAYLGVYDVLDYLDQEEECMQTINSFLGVHATAALGYVQAALEAHAEDPPKGVKIAKGARVVDKRWVARVARADGFGMKNQRAAPARLVEALRQLERRGHIKLHHVRMAGAHADATFISVVNGDAGQ